MRCGKCGKEYPSEHYFKTTNVCKECYTKNECFGAEGDCR